MTSVSSTLNYANYILVDIFVGKMSGNENIKYRELKKTNNSQELFGLFLMNAENFAKMSAPTSNDSLLMGLR